MKNARVGSIVVIAALAAACGGKAESEDQPSTGGSSGSGGSGAFAGQPAGGTGGTPASGGGGASTGGTGGDAGGGAGGAGGTGTGGAPPCVQQGDGWNSNSDPTCKDLDVLGVFDPVVESANGDAKVAPGESFTLKVRLSEVKGIGFGMYPGVKFTSDHPGVSIKENDWFYGIFGCQSYDASATGQIEANVPSGTVVKLTAQAAMLNSDCPEAPSVTYTLSVE